MCFNDCNCGSLLTNLHPVRGTEAHQRWSWATFPQKGGKQMSQGVYYRAWEVAALGDLSVSLLTALSHSLCLDTNSIYDPSYLRDFLPREGVLTKFYLNLFFKFTGSLKTLHISYFPHLSSSKGKREKWASGFTQQLITNSFKRPAFMKWATQEENSAREDVGSMLPGAGSPRPSTLPAAGSGKENQGSGRVWVL